MFKFRGKLHLTSQLEGYTKVRALPPGKQGQIPSGFIHWLASECRSRMSHWYAAVIGHTLALLDVTMFGFVFLIPKSRQFSPPLLGCSLKLAVNGGRRWGMFLFTFSVQKHECEPVGWANLRLSQFPPLTENCLKLHRAASSREPSSLTTSAMVTGPVPSAHNFFCGWSWVLLFGSLGCWNSATCSQGAICKWFVWSCCLSTLVN